MQTQSRLFIWPVRVYIEDTDAGGIVYHAHYLRFMERARTEYWRQCGWHQSFAQNTEALWVVYRMQVEYRKPARFDDELSVVTRVVRVGRAHVVWEQHIQRDGCILCVAEVVIACVHPASMKPQSMPKAMYQSLRAKVNTVL